MKRYCSLNGEAYYGENSLSIKICFFNNNIIYNMFFDENFSHTVIFIHSGLAIINILTFVCLMVDCERFNKII
jgi:hypothetical protein